jgi:hypothetical protein
MVRTAPTQLIVRHRGFRRTTRRLTTRAPCRHRSLPRQALAPADARRFRHRPDERRRRRDREVASRRVGGFGLTRSGLPDHISPLVLVVGHDVERWVEGERIAVADVSPVPPLAGAGRPADRCHPRRPARLAEVIEEAHDRCVLDDEGDQPQRAATAPTAQRIDFVDAGDQPRPGADAGWCGLRIPVGIGWPLPRWRRS